MTDNSKVVMADKRFMMEVLGLLKDIAMLILKVSDKLERK